MPLVLDQFSLEERLVRDVSWERGLALRQWVISVPKQLLNQFL